MKKFYKLEDIADFENINNFFSAAAAPTFSADAPEIQLWDEAQFEDIFEKHSEKSLYIKETSDPWGAFKNKYSQWKARNGRFIADELSALLQKYNPIHNYDRHEVHSGSDIQTKTPADWITTKTETPDNWKQTTTQKPTNWKETQTQTPTNWKETETQTPTNWKETETQTPTEWTETETKTPTNWQDESVKTFSNYHETETQTPTNWETTKTDTPTNWQKTNTETFTNYHETETQTPTNWQKETVQLDSANGEGTEHKIIPFNGSDFANVSADITQRSQNTKESQTGTYQTDKQLAGTKTNTENQTGTYQTVTAQDGTFETDRTKSGTETDTVTHSGTFVTETERTGTYETEREQSGTFETERVQTGIFTTETAHSGTYETEVATSGSRTEQTEQTGTFEDLMEYGKVVDVSGNIGVTTTAEMINQILKLYDVDFAERWITRFINSCCVYV